MLILGALADSSSHKLPEKGVPLLQNLAPVDYNHQGKVWDIDTSPNGIVYMAADKGLLEYDGNRWKSYKGSDGITRSVLVINDSLIYTGSDLDFGFWERNIYQDFEYTSLYPFKEDLNTINEEFWGIHVINQTMYFVSGSNIYVYKDKNLTKIPAPNRIESSFTVSDILYFADSENGLYQLNDLAPEHLFHFPEGNSLELSGMYQHPEGLILVTKNEGLFQYDSGNLRAVNSRLSQELKTANAFSFEQVGDSYLAFGTILKGLYITDLDGDIVHHINKSKGLQNNTILSLHHNSFGKLWMGLDYGVSYLDLNNEFTFFYDYRGDFGTGYSAVLKDDVFYLGTNQGLYKAKWEDLNNSTEFNKFELISGTEGQVWKLKTIEDQIWIGHDGGLFLLQNDRIKDLNNEKGVWDIQPYKDYILAGTYNGISVFTRGNDAWVYQEQMELILGSCNQVLIEGDNALWINIPNFGVIKAELDENLYPIQRQIFLKEQFKGNDHYLVKSEEGISVLTDTHNHIYDPVQNSFKEEIRTERNSVVDDLGISTIQPTLLNDDFEFFPVYNGFALRHLNTNQEKKNTAYQLVFRSVEAFNNESRMEVYNEVELPSQFNNFEIKSVVPNQQDVMYQYKTQEADEWSNWIVDGTFELIGLEYGLHVLSARAKVNGKITPVETISFSIAPPWYQSKYAYAFYSGLFILFVYVLYTRQKASLKKLEKDLLIDRQNTLHEQEKRHKRQLQLIEEASLRAEHEQLKAQLKSKTIELANKARENEEKNEVLSSLKEKFELLKKNPDSLKRRSVEIQQILDSYLSSDDNTFEIQMNELHQEFFKNLKQKFPDLTSHDLRLCAYIKIGFNSKEVSDLFNIKPSSVYISRSRLRKKLGLDTDTDLHGYLNSI